MILPLAMGKKGQIISKDAHTAAKFLMAILRGLTMTIEEIKQHHDQLVKMSRLNMNNENWKRIEFLLRDVESTRTRLANFCGYILSCKRENTDEWMECLVDTVNLVANSLGDEQRFEYRKGEIKTKGPETI